ncbi:MAG: regulatory protein RecX [Ardenticatenaceae bacterium]|nr:MAG: regulatory protein RecX [Ardenticatenaceae bacterium]
MFWLFAAVPLVSWAMGKITSLTRQKRNPNRINVFIDGAFAFGLAEITAAYLRIGQELSTADIDKLQGADQFEKAKELAIRYIEYRPRSITETRRHLLKKEYPEPVVDEVLERLEAVDLLNDPAFARYWVEQRETFKPRSKIALQHELRQKGIERQIIDEAVAEVDEFAAAKQAAEPKARRWYTLSEQEFRKKLGGFLQRRGFGYGIVKEITDSLWQAHHSDEE